MKNKPKFSFLLRQYLIVGVVAFVAMINFGCQQNIVVQSGATKLEQITAMYREYAEEFPEVKGITARELQKLQQQGKKIVLVDVRSPKERVISIIPGAISSEEFEDNLEQYRNIETVVIAYCTIGYRSGKYAKKLRQKGIDILNLEGSLLAWSHIQGELVNENGSTKKVHVFNRQWQLTADNYQPIW